MKNSIPAELEIPVGFCDVSVLHVTPFSTESRHRQVREAHEVGGLLDLPIVRPKGSRFEVIQGWDLVYIAGEMGLSRIKVAYAEFTDDDAVFLGITEQVRKLGLHWIDEALALRNAKDVLKCDDLRLANATGYSRSKLTRLINITRKLSPKFIQLAKLNRLSFTACRKLITLSSTRQEALVCEMISKSLSEQALMKKAFPSDVPSRASDSLSINEHQKSNIKSFEVKKLEVDLSDRVHCPVSVTPSSGGDIGKIDFSFFGLLDLEGLAENIRTGVRRGANPTLSLQFDLSLLELVAFSERLSSFIGGATKVKGRVRYEYANLDSLDSLIENHFTDEQ